MDCHERRDSVLIEQLEEKKGFTNSEAIIAEYILKNPFQVTDLTAKELGEKTFTSKASVFRFCKKIGVESYDELKHKLEIEMNEKSRLENLLKQEPVGSESSLKDITNIIPSVYEIAISNMKMMLDYNVLNRIVERLKKAEKIDIYCGGITSSCAASAAFKFLSIGTECSVHTGINEHYVMSIRNKKTVSIILSFTGRNRAMIRTARYLKRAGIYLVGIGGAESQELQRLCNGYIEIFQKTLITSLEVLTPYISLTYVFDILFTALLVSKYDKNLSDSLDVLKFKDLNYKPQK